MNKNFTKEDIIKKHQTNVKSAITAFCLAGILGVAYVVRYFIVGNFNFYFSLAYTEGVLKFIENGSMVPTVGYIMIGVFAALYIAGIILIAKNPRTLYYALVVYVNDFVFLIYLILSNLSTFTPDRLIDVIIHIFITIFISVGVASEKKLRKINESQELK